MSFYHVWFGTKKRLPALQGEIDDFVCKEMRDVATRRGIHIVELQTAFDHVHLLLQLERHQKLPVVMHDLKGATARAVFLRFVELKLDMESNSFWQKSYGTRRVPPEQVDLVRQYIRTQLERDVRHA